MSIELVESSRHFLFHRLVSQELFCRYRRGLLKVRYHEPWKRRHIDVSHLIAEAIEHLDVGKVPPFYVNTGDRPRKKPRPRTLFGSCAVEGCQDIAAPDAMYGTWPEARIDDYDAACRSIAAASAGPPVDARAFWTGRVNIKWRRELRAVAERHSDLIEARVLNHAFDHETHVYVDEFIPLDEQVARYRYMIDVEGSGYSGRLKLLLHAGRVVLMQERPWHEWFFPLLRPFHHYVPVARDLSDLPARIEWLKANPEREHAIIAEAQQFARRHLTRVAAVEAWASLLKAHIAARGRLTAASPQ